MEYELVRTRMRAGIIGGFTLLALACAMLIIATWANNSADHLVDHSLRVRQRTGELFSLVQDAETGQRGYLLTGDRTYLAPFVKARAELPALEEKVRHVVATSPEDQVDADALFPLIAKKMDELSLTIKLDDAKNLDASLAEIKTNRGRDLMDLIRLHVKAIEDNENALLSQRVAAAAMQRVVLMSAIAFVIALAALLAFFVTRESRQYGRAMREKNASLLNEMQQRETVQQQLRQSQKMEALGQLTGGVAHDFNNMLAIIVGNLEMLLRRLPEDDMRCHTMANNALTGAMRAAELTKRLLAFSRQQPLQPKATDINLCVREMSAMLSRSLGENIQIETVQGGGLWRAFVDRPQLESAILNLAVNSRDAMKGMGRLTIETANAVLDSQYAQTHEEVAAGQYVMIALTDTGNGMSAEVMHKAFDPFFTTKEVGKGTGLGLSQVHGFTKQSRGHVKIYSEIGVGTTVKIYLPRDVSQATEEVARAVPTELPLVTQRKVLVVEDEPEVRAFVIAALQELGYATAEAENEATARHALGTDPEISVMITDVIMPGVNGRQLVDAVRDSFPELIVIFMTGYTRNAIVHNGMLDVGVRLLSKPFSIDELARELRAAIAESTSPPDTLEI